MRSFYWLMLGILAVWRVTYALTAEDGPWDTLARLRRRAGGGFWGTLLGCFYCSSLWVAAPAAYLIGQSLDESILLWLSLSAGAILTERAAARQIARASYSEDDEARHVLRQE